MKSEDKIERWIDEALRQYGNVDASPGFEVRVLARVKEREVAFRARQRLWWAFGFSAALTTVLLASLGLFHRTHLPDPPVAQRHSDQVMTTKAIPEHRRLPGAETKQEAPTERHARSATSHKQPSGTTSASETPKLDQFPSPTPLSEQEQIMAQYVSAHRQHAVMLARAETDLFERESRERSTQVTGSEGRLSEDKE